ncbi:hypothetical protein [Arcticibacter svalbardensis]|uniref:hypothetical protein n=1 Tax=Arcticibacter svalbardensis TaxID=1288027 RepID=UPI00190F30D4|nr:hypothetical protein [Arcticibacter svalbardensis]
MKKFFVTLFVVFYLGVSSGATMHFHYCMGQLVDMGLEMDGKESANYRGPNYLSFSGNPQYKICAGRYNGRARFE